MIEKNINLVKNSKTKRKTENRNGQVQYQITGIEKIKIEWIKWRGKKLLQSKISENKYINERIKCEKNQTQVILKIQFIKIIRKANERIKKKIIAIKVIRWEICQTTRRNRAKKGRKSKVLYQQR